MLLSKSTALSPTFESQPVWQNIPKTSLMDTACCTCAQLLAHVSPVYDEKTEKPKAQDRRLDCCERVICGNCIHSNSRFATYCKSSSPLHLPNFKATIPPYTSW